jgi:hypothetical protein
LLIKSKLKGPKEDVIRILLFVLIVALCSVAQASPNKKFDFLLRFFDLNEAAFAYHRHCLSASEGLNETFLNTMEFVADELLDEGIKENPSIKPEQIRAKILERRYNLQYKFDNANMREGCFSKDSELAKTHYSEFSRFDRKQIENFITENTSN